MPRMMIKTSYILLISGLIFAPLAFGTVEQWSLVVLELSSALAYTAFFFAAWFYKDRVLHIPGLLPLVLILGLMALQMVPMPSGLVQLISPGTYKAYAPILSVSGDSSWISLSVNRRATLHELLRIASYSLLYVLTVQILSQPQKLKKIINIVVLLASVVAFFAIVQKFSSPDKIFWVREVPGNASPFGPWINPNQFAGYMELIFPLTFGLFLFYKPRVRDKESFRKKIVSFFTVPEINSHLFLGFSSVLIALSVFVSLCRGGILSIIVSGMVFLFLFKRKFPGSGRTSLFLIIASILLSISWFGWDIILSEFNQGFDTAGNISDGRLTLWSDIIGIIKEFPVFGAGFGSFLYIYPLYRTIGGDLIYDHAHNDYLELLTDGGVIGFILVAWFLWAVLSHGLKMISVRRDRYAVLIGIGCVSGIVALLAHSVTDFNMHNGAVGFYFFFLCGAMVATVNVRFGHYSSGSLLRTYPDRVKIFFAVAGLLLLSVISVVQGGAFWAWSKYNEIENIYVSRQLSGKYLQKISDNMRQAILADPLEGLYSYKLGIAEWYGDEKQQALKYHLAAVQKNPLDGVFLQQLGLLLPDDKGKQLIEEGYLRALKKESLVLNYVDWLLWKGSRSEAMDVLAERLLKNETKIIKLLPLLNSNSFTRDEIVEILPSTVDAWLQYGRYCEVNNKLADAEFFFDSAYDMLLNITELKPQWFNVIINFYRRQGLNEKGLAVLRQAVDRVPDSANFHILLGDYYRNKGIIYRAKEEFERALILEPASAQARSRLRKMGFADSY